MKRICDHHGHEDHIGAFPYVLRELNLPIYATKLTMGIIEKKLTEHNLLRSHKKKSSKTRTVDQSGTVPDRIYQDKPQYSGCSGTGNLFPAGIVVHTGDFKVDYTPVFGDAIDLQSFAEIGKKRCTGTDVGQYQCGTTGLYPV